MTTIVAHRRPHGSSSAGSQSWARQNSASRRRSRQKTETRLDRRQRLADAGDLRGCLPPAADHAEARRALPREVTRRHGRGGAGPHLPELVGLDHRREPGRRDRARRAGRQTASRFRSRHTTSARRTRARGRHTAIAAYWPSSSGRRSRGRLSTTPRASRPSDPSTAASATGAVRSCSTSASVRKRAAIIPSFSAERSPLRAPARTGGVANRRECAWGVPRRRASSSCHFRAATGSPGRWSQVVVKGRRRR